MNEPVFPPVPHPNHLTLMLDASYVTPLLPSPKYPSGGYQVTIPYDLLPVTPGLIFQTAAKLTPEEKEELEKQIESYRSGSSKMMILQGVERQSMRDHVLSIQRVPPIRIGNIGEGTYSSSHPHEDDPTPDITI